MRDRVVWSWCWRWESSESEQHNEHTLPIKYSGSCHVPMAGQALAMFESLTGRLCRYTRANSAGVGASRHSICTRLGSWRCAPANNTLLPS